MGTTDQTAPSRARSATRSGQLVMHWFVDEHGGLTCSWIAAGKEPVQPPAPVLSLAS